MPLAIKKNYGKNTYKVYNKDTKQVHSYATTKAKAIKQVALINMIDAKKKKGKK